MHELRCRLTDVHVKEKIVDEFPHSERHSLASWQEVRGDSFVIMSAKVQRGRQKGGGQPKLCHFYIKHLCWGEVSLLPALALGFAKGGFQKGGFGGLVPTNGTRAHSDVPPVPYIRMFRGRINGDLKRVIWGLAPRRATLNTPFSTLCPRILGTRFYKTTVLRNVSGANQWWFEKGDLRLLLAERLWTPHFQPFVQEFSAHGLQITVLRVSGKIVGKISRHFVTLLRRFLRICQMNKETDMSQNCLDVSQEPLNAPFLNRLVSSGF